MMTEYDLTCCLTYDRGVHLHSSIWGQEILHRFWVEGGNVYYFSMDCTAPCTTPKRDQVIICDPTRGAIFEPPPLDKIKTHGRWESRYFMTPDQAKCTMGLEPGDRVWIKSADYDRLKRQCQRICGTAMILPTAVSRLVINYIFPL